ncbi:MAG: NUDIX domain-containing protein [Candidatus Cloacimonetes bacterium]|nr:NUDIX domain-containing protein [Candidatus Cloacimonadota bacterium]MBL7086379.1 NUDIX domain-containing protein [Candidatus Cloacimonadota bacterium]
MNPTKDVKYCIKCGNLLSDKKEGGKVRKKCDSCGWTYYENPVPACACVIVNEKNEILLIKRKVEPAEGCWALPSGYIEIDETPEETAVKELEEETGLKGKIIKFLGYFEQDSPVCKKVISFGFHLQATGGMLKARDDALDAKFFPFPQMPDIPFSSHIEFIKIIKKEIDINLAP